MKTNETKRTLLRGAGMFALSLALPFGADVTAKEEPGLADYRPREKISGAIRIWGAGHMAGLMRIWQEPFRKIHPGIFFENNLKGTASAQFALQMNVADLALSGRQIFPYEYYGIYRRSQRLTVEIAVATGSYNVPGKSTAIGVFVHQDNPLAKLTLEQLDGIYSDQRTGGWQRMEWVTEVARSSEKNIRSWGQLGLDGEWANAPIRVYGPPGLYPGGVSFFQTRVMGGSDVWNEALQEFDDRAAMMAALSKDRYGIAYTTLAHATPLVKALALAERMGDTYYGLTRENVARHNYPLSRFAYIYFAPDTPVGDAAKIDPKLREFLSFILSRQGQGLIKREGDYFPLPDAVAREQLKKLD